MSKSANARQPDVDTSDDSNDLNIEGLWVADEAGEVEAEARKLSGLPLEADSASETEGSGAPQSPDEPDDEEPAQSLAQSLHQPDDDPIGEEARAVERMAYDMELSLSGASQDLTDAVDTLLEVEDEEADNDTTDDDTAEDETFGDETPDDTPAEDGGPGADPDDGTSGDADPDEDAGPKRHHHKGRHHHGKSGKKS